jgi:hypothetical protein
MALKAGCVTTLESVLGKTDQELEAALGYKRGWLRPSFELYALAEPVLAGEFLWLDKTRYSAGWHADPSIDLGDGLIWSVPRDAELRAAFGRKLNYDEKAVDQEIAKLREKDVERLNVRAGTKRIVKVVPQNHSSDPKDFPDAISGNTPQWQLTVPKQFSLVGKFNGVAPYTLY